MGGGGTIMKRYIVKRLLQTVIVIIGVTVISFGVLFMTGDPTVLLLGDNARGMSQEKIEEFRHNMGFDKPWLVQYANYMKNVFGGVFGMKIIDEVIIEGHAAAPDKAETIIAEGLEKVAAVAKSLSAVAV
jgi:ABC-type dipeptide/oligopeptide/nickel transport system permease component